MIRVILGAALGLAAGLAWRSARERALERRLVESSEQRALSAVSRQLRQERSSDSLFARENEALKERPPSAKPRVVFLGDSITAGWDLSSALAGLDAELVNRAVAGQTTESNLRRLRRDALELSPRVVVLLAGTNDILGHWKTQATTQNLAAMIEMARASGARVLACAVPRMDLSQGTDVDARAVNAWLERYCAAGRCRYVDYYAALSPLEPGLLADGVHPTAAGYGRMALPLRRALAAELAR